MNNRDKVSCLTQYLVHLYESRDTWAKEACLHSPISKLPATGVRVLEALDCEEPVNMGALSTKTDMPLSTLTGIVDKLVESGLLQRTRSRQDRRVVEVGITDHGCLALNHRKDAHAAMSQHILDTLSSTEQETLIRILAKIVST